MNDSRIAQDVMSTDVERWSKCGLVPLVEFGIATDGNSAVLEMLPWLLRRHVSHVSFQLIQAFLPRGLVILSCSALALRHKEWTSHTPRLVWPNYPLVATHIDRPAFHLVLGSVDKPISLLK
jgi:hypothetical protein